MAGGRAVPIEYDLPQSEVRKRCFHCLYMLLVNTLLYCAPAFHIFLHKLIVRCDESQYEQDCVHIFAITIQHLGCQLGQSTQERTA